MILNSDTLDAVKRMAQEWPQGIFIFRPLDGDLIIMAVDDVKLYDPSNHFHQITVMGRDVTLMIINKASSMSSPRSMMEAIEKQHLETWHLSYQEKFYWVNLSS